MRGKYRKKVWLCAALAAVLCLTLMLPHKNSLARVLLDTEREENTLKVNKENLASEDLLKEDASLANAEVQVYLYKLATVDEYGQYTLVDGFKDLAGQLPEGVLDIEALNRTVFDATSDQWETTAHWVSELLGLPAFTSEKNENNEDSDDKETPPEGEQKSDGKKFYIPENETLIGLPCYDKTILAGDGIDYDVDQGLYLVWAKPIVTEKYMYTFLPYLVSVPDNAYGREDDLNKDSDDWNYNVVVDLKPERQERYLDLEIDKTLLNYQPTSGKAMFIFEIRAEKGTTEEGDPIVVFHDVVGLEFNGDGNKSVRVRNIPAGSKVTITEIRTGTTYQLVSKKVVPADGITLGTTETADGFVIDSLSGKADWVSSQGTGEGENELAATVSFTNDYSGEDRPKTDGIVNQFTRIDGEWKGAQIITNQGGGAANE